MNQMQLDNFSHLVSLGVPDEWAYLIAERSTASVYWNNPSDFLGEAFMWSDTDEGFYFWESFYAGLLDMEEAK